MITLREGPKAPYLTDRDQKNRVSASKSLLMLNPDVAGSAKCTRWCVGASTNKGVVRASEDFGPSSGRRDEICSAQAESGVPETYSYAQKKQGAQAELKMTPRAPPSLTLQRGYIPAEPDRPYRPWPELARLRADRSSREQPEVTRARKLSCAFAQRGLLTNVMASARTNGWREPGILPRSLTNDK